MCSALLFFTEKSYAATKPYATAKVNSSNGVNIRKSSTTSSSIVKSVANNTKLTINREVFKTKSSTKSTKRWYYVTVGGKNGYIRADLVDSFIYYTATGKTTDGINYRKGAGTGMTRVGSLAAGKTITLRLPAKASDGSSWYRALINNKNYYVSADYVKKITTVTVSDNPNRSDVAKALLKKATSGGASRTVYTFDENNCKKKFAVEGYDGIVTPQGLAYDGTNYRVLFASTGGDKLVKYSPSGERLSRVSFNKNRGHLNGMTWDAVAKKFYIFKGNQKTVYTYTPSTSKFGTATTPYSSSGVGYDRVKKVVYCSSQTGIRKYKAGGNFEHLELFSKCSHSGTYYIQDCCAHDGYIFHCISGANKKTQNWIDVYRAADAKYLGSIEVTMGEVESCVVNKSGYLEILINMTGTKEYIWKTPLKVADLK